MKDPSSISDRQLAHELAIVNCKWDVISRQGNVRVCHLNHSEASWRLEQPVNCIFEDIKRIHHLLGIDSWCVIWQLSIENGMSYQVKTTSMYVFWTIWSCHGALEWSVNCTSEYIWWIHYLMEEESLSRSRQLLTENEMSYQSETTSRHVISTIQSCHGTLEQLVNCILKYIWRIHIYWEYTACAWVGNFQLRMECHIKARQRQGISFKPFRAIIAPWNSPSTASLKSFGGSII